MNLSTKINFRIFLLFIALSFDSTNVSAVSINGSISHRQFHQQQWDNFKNELEMTIEGGMIGEVGVLPHGENFTFVEINPNDTVRIQWRIDNFGMSRFVLFPYKSEGKASELSGGTLRFKFREFDWVVLEFKRKVANEVSNRDISGIDRIFTHAKHYYEMFSVNQEIDNSQATEKGFSKTDIQRFNHKLLQFICQKSQELRRSDNSVFFQPENVELQRSWLMELLNITGESDYSSVYPAAFIRALNEWVIFTRQSYTKNSRWSDRKINLDGEQDLDRSFRNEKSREYLKTDINKIVGIIEQNSNLSLGEHPFQDNSKLDMNAVSNWIALINRNVK